jgi:hypothetical protein
LITPEDWAFCFEIYIASVIAFAIIGYIMHRVSPYGKYVPHDFVPPDRYIGSFSRGQLVSYLIRTFACPLVVALAVILAYLDLPETPASVLCLVLILAVEFASTKVEKMIDDYYG